MIHMTVLHMKLCKIVRQTDETPETGLLRTPNMQAEARGSYNVMPEG